MRGVAGNCTTGYNYGVMGALKGTNKGAGKVENGTTVISSRHGVTIENSFEVEPGASFEIRTN